MGKFMTGEPEDWRPSGVDAAQELTEGRGESTPEVRDELADKRGSFVRSGAGYLPRNPSSLFAPSGHGESG